MSMCAGRETELGAHTSESETCAISNDDCHDYTHDGRIGHDEYDRAPSDAR